jgi:hypothetical protein
MQKSAIDFAIEAAVPVRSFFVFGSRSVSASRERDVPPA